MFLPRSPDSNSSAMSSVVVSAEALVPTIELTCAFKESIKRKSSNEVEVSADESVAVVLRVDEPTAVCADPRGCSGAAVCADP